MRRAEHRGFTLIELIAGLALVGVAFTSALLLIDGLRDARDRLLRHARVENRTSNGAELLRQFIARAEAPGTSLARFAGTTNDATFRTWCDAPGGWLERCVVRVWLDRDSDSSFVRADLSTGERLTLLASRGELRLRYFAVIAAQALWMPAWNSVGTLPSAVGVLSSGDTLVFTVNGRGR